MKCSTRHFYEFDPFRLEPAERLLLREGQPVPLMPKAFDTLLVLVRNGGNLVKKDELMGEVWPGVIVDESVLARSISVLRKALGEGPKDHKYIETVSGYGYRFVARVEEKWEKQAESADVASDTSPIVEPKRRWKPWLAITIPIIFLVLIFAERWLKREAAPTGPELKQLSSGGISATRPMVSPDGRIVLYVSDGDLYIVPAAGGDVLRITDNAHVAGDMPVFTADGASIVFSRYRDGEEGTRLPDLWIVPSLGGTPRRFLAEASGAHFSPDGKWVAYTKHFPDKKPFWISPVERLEEHREVADPGFTPRWSPDGKWMAYTTGDPGRGADGVLWVVSASLSDRRQVTKDPQPIYGLTWRDDSRSLIFASGGVRRFHLYQASLTGGSIKTITTGVGDYVSPSISPDGKTLIFCHANSMRDLRMADSVGNPKVEKNVTQGEFHLWPRLSPSGERVASVSQQLDFNEHLYVTDLKTGKSARVSDRIAYHPYWLDEDRLAYLSFNGSVEKTDVYVANLTTGANFPWSQIQGKADWLAVHPDQKKLAFVANPSAGKQTLTMRDLGNQTELILAEGAEYEELRWSPNGSALSWSGPFLSGGAASNGVWMIEPGQGQPRRVVQDGYGPVWSADGASLYFFRFPGTLWQFDLRRNVPTKVRDWGLMEFDLIGERLVFTQISNRSQIYSMPLN